MLRTRSHGRWAASSVLAPLLAVGCGAAGETDAGQDGTQGQVVLPALVAESVIDTTAVELTPEQRDELEAACADAAGVPGSNDDCKKAVELIPADRPCVRLCLVLGTSVADTASGVLAVVDVTQAGDPCAAGRALCGGVPVALETVDDVRDVVGTVATTTVPTTSPTTSDTPTPTTGPTRSATPTSSASPSASPSAPADASQLPTSG